MAFAIKKHGFQCGKAVKLWCWPDATAKGRKEATWAERTAVFFKFRPSLAGFRWGTCQSRYLLRAFEMAFDSLFPGSRGFILAKNMPFGGFSTGLQR
jgi:hypothetical protein